MLVISFAIGIIIADDALAVCNVNQCLQEIQRSILNYGFG
jgi:hypothetical protein